MPGIILPPSPRQNAMKRQADDLTNGQLQNDDQERPTKRARIHKHGVKFRQTGAIQSLQGAQDEVFFQSQLIRAISLSLAAQGFDAIESSALESFRLATESYMMRFLGSVSSSMRSTRREAPTAEDFSFALAKSQLGSSSLSPFLSIPPNPSICQPPIPVPPDILKPGKDSDVSLSSILQDSQDKQGVKRKHIPKHFPGLPSSHTWKMTAVFQSREGDARDLRERATQEGVMAEQALRRLTEASRSAVRHKDMTSHGDTLGKTAKSWDKVLNLIERKDQEALEMDNRSEREPSDPLFSRSNVVKASRDSQEDETFEATAVVNHDRLGWRALSIAKS